MASAVYSEPPGSRLSISLEGEACASPFPSPSSSFLPPPTPGAHEFAVKPAPPARNGRKSSAAHISNPPPPREAESISGDTASLNSETKLQRSSLNGVQGHPIHPNGYGSSLLPTSKESSSPAPSSPSLLSPTTPTPYTFQHQPAPMNNLEPPRSPTVDQSTSSSTTPTILTTALPPADTPGPSALDAKKQSGSPSKIIIPDTLDAAASSTSASGPSSPAFSSFGSSSRPISASINADPSLFSNRPAPPSPAMSRRVSGAPSMSSTRSKSSRPPSQVVSRANSLRKSTSRSTRGSPVINPHRQSLGTQLSQSFAPLPSPQKLIFALSVSSASTSMSTSSAASPSASSSLPVTPASLQKRVSAVVYIKIRDFGFPASDERHIGLGPDVPKPNKVGRMNRRLGGRTLSQGSVESSDGDGEEEVDDDVDGWGDNGVGGGWDGFRMGLGRFSWNTGGAGASSNFEAPRRTQDMRGSRARWT
ncbi:hypothetical protein BDZ97DRAFT_1913323 [Flammula alnicola]|nr:hypothetical protein BDZ97DRAFT_1913323 [Flammula alnicola]